MKYAELNGHRVTMYSRYRLQFFYTIADVKLNIQYLCSVQIRLTLGDVRRSTKSADFICRQNRPTKSVVCHAKMPDFVDQDRACSIFDDFVGRLFIYRTTNFVYVAMVIVYNLSLIHI